MRFGRVIAVALSAAAGSLAVSGSLPVVSEAAAGRASTLSWRDCGKGFQCATARVPLNYRRPRGRQIALAVMRLPVQDRGQRIGSLFLNPGGPGGSGIELLREEEDRAGLAALNDRFDLVSWDPRGVGASAGALDCAVDSEQDGPYGQPFARPGRRSERRLRRRVTRYVRRCVRRAGRPGVLSHIHTANTARDLDRLRAAVGDRKLSYLGYSYGTQIGATYATLFPRRVRVLALDGGVDVEGFVNDPIRDFRRQTRAFEHALERFLAACGRRPDRCGLDGSDPRVGYDELLARLDRRPLPAPPAADRGPINGDDLRAASLATLTRKQLWPVLATALKQAQLGDGSLIRAVVDVYYDVGVPDSFVGIYALDARWPRRPALYLRDGRSAHRSFEHFWWNAGYSALAFGLWPVKPLGAYYGPIENSRRATTALVIGTTHDPQTPYVWAKRLTADLGNARLLTMRGDGHTASFHGNSPCIDAAVEAYLERRLLPRPGTACPQQVPFASTTLVRTTHQGLKQLQLWR